MASICSVFIDKQTVQPRAHLVTRCVKDLFPIESLSCSSRRFYPQKRPESRNLCLKRLISYPCKTSYVDYGKRHHLYRKLSEVHLAVVYAMDRDPGSASKEVSEVVKSCPVESKHPLQDGITGQLKTLDLYFTKLDGDNMELPELTSHKIDTLNGEDREILQKNMAGHGIDAIKLMKSDLGLLDNYFDKLNTYRGKSESENNEQLVGTGSKERREFINEKNDVKGQQFLQNLNNFASKSSLKDDIRPVSFEDISYEEVGMDESNFSLISLFSSINIGVYLFEIASPVRDANFEQLSLPLLYGAKVNKLILDGEWWRLVTPMFLHSGFLHVALSCWVLLSFGPKVCRAYGPFTFFLMYMLGGICANLTSFMHTSEPTVSGTGPIFAIIGAWLIYQFQNKEKISKEVSDDMYRKAVIATALSFFLTDSSQIDEWTQLAAAVSGVLYGYFTCPTLQMNNSNPRNNQKEGSVIARQQANSLKSALIFIIFIMALYPLVYMSIPDPNISEIDTFLE